MDEQNSEVASASDSGDQPAQQVAKVSVPGTTSTDAKKQVSSEEEAQVERVMPDTEGDSDQPLDQPTA